MAKDLTYITFSYIFTSRDFNFIFEITNWSFAVLWGFDQRHRDNFLMGIFYIVKSSSQISVLDNLFIVESCYTFLFRRSVQGF